MKKEVTYSSKEKSQVRAFEQLVAEKEVQAQRLEKAITTAKSEFQEFDEHRLLEIAISRDPFKDFQRAVLPMLEREEVLKRFIETMPRMVDAIRTEGKGYSEEIESIKAVAEKRQADILLLESQLAVDGDLPTEQRRLLLDLKAKSA